MSICFGRRLTYCRSAAGPAGAKRRVGAPLAPASGVTTGTGGCSGVLGGILRFIHFLRPVPRGNYPNRLLPYTVEETIGSNYDLTMRQVRKLRNKPTRFWIPFKSSKCLLR
jgi:hypothetical protein